MGLHERKVLLKKYNVFKSFFEKEWWYTNCFDQKNKLYLSWFYFRSFGTDQFNVWVYHIPSKRSWSRNKTNFLKKPERNDRLDLVLTCNAYTAHYLEENDEKRTFAFKSEKMAIDLTLGKNEISLITNRENSFDTTINLMQLFHLPVTGTVCLDNKEYDINTNISYADHCYGRFERKVGWHWLAVQNDQIGLALLVNYGVNPQKFAQIFWSGQWIRLNQNTSFEYDHTNPGTVWQVTSPDVDLEVSILAEHGNITHIPPLIPLFANINHKEFLVSVHGKVRINDKMEQIKNLYGVMEEHFGIW